ncbi:CD209 antigen-like [Pimephales promelas]|uniref:CD209 antigen-like n=1 Tax=Pimephales promelas TaxID=90988 RepID=UPI0019558C63|nr:CD209 antigen-like [Pimephales promelas]
MELEDIYENFENDDIKDTTGARTQNHSQDEGKDGKCGGRRCLVLMTVCLGLICVLLLVFITLYITITAERNLLKSYKNTVEEFNHTIISLQDKNTNLMTENDQLKNKFNSLSQKKLDLETRVNDLTAEKSQLRGSFDALNQKKLELETRVNDLTAEKSQLQGSFDALNQKKLELETDLRELSKRGNGWFFISSELKSWSESRQFCRDRGADLIIINTEEKQRFISSFIKESVWIGLSDIENEGNMKWVDNSPLKQGFWERNEPNNADGNEDCIELNPAKLVPNNWNDIPCSTMRKWICGN